jgi:hypothetical protein
MSWREISASPTLDIAIAALVIATIAGLVVVLGRRRAPARRRGRAYTFPKQKNERELVHALGQASALQIAILKFIVDGYLLGVDAGEVAAHFKIHRREAAKHLKVLHRLGLLYIKQCDGGKIIFFLIESAMSRIGEPRFFNMIGLNGLA